MNAVQFKKEQKYHLINHRNSKIYCIRFRNKDWAEYPITENPPKNSICIMCLESAEWEKEKEEMYRVYEERGV